VNALAPRRFPGVQAPHEDKKWSANLEEKASQRKKEAHRLNLGLPRSLRIRSRSDYLRVQHSGQRARGRYLIVLAMENGLSYARFGITVSRKTGNAVTRNRIKRRIKEFQRLNQEIILPGKDVVIIATRAAAEANFRPMEAEYLELARKAGLTEGA